MFYFSFILIFALIFHEKFGRFVALFAAALLLTAERRQFLIAAQKDCADKTHFNYNCWQLSVYCDTPQAEGVRQSCPRTCGVCGGSTRFAANSDARGFDLEAAAARAPAAQPPPNYVVRQPPVGDGQRRAEPEVRNSETPTSFRGNVRPIVNNNNNPQFAASSGDVSDSDADQRLRSCCSSRSISSGCISLCTYSTTKADVLSKAIVGSCTLDDARIWVQCASNGRKNSQCCRNYGIYGCDGICNGKIDGDFSQLLTCVDNYLETILKCHKNGLSG